jgi:hypothetical protein
MFTSVTQWERKSLLEDISFKLSAMQRSDFCIMGRYLNFNTKYQNFETRIS